MQNVTKPELRPANPSFSSGPCPKFPGWTPAVLEQALVGRSHRSAEGKALLAEAISETRRLLDIPEDYRIGIVPASDTGAMEMALWSLLGERGVDVLAWESFGQDWLKDIREHLRLEDCRAFTADYGALPDLAAVDWNHDVVFVWNGTTSGVRLPDGGWIADDRAGLAICDATSALFAQFVPWEKLDVVTFSWQKALGGEGGHGMIVLSPKAVARLEAGSPRPLPKIFRMTAKGKLNEGIFKGETINTPSMLCVADYLAALNWADSVGGLDALISRANANYNAIAQWVERTDWIEFLCPNPDIRSNTSVCLKLAGDAPEDRQKEIISRITKSLAAEKAAYDIGGYRAAPPGLRIWAGATVEEADLKRLFPWLDWAFSQASA